MSRRAKLLAAARNNPRDVSFEDLRKLLEDAGCVCRQSSSGGSHYVFTHSVVQKQLSIPRSRPVKKVYVDIALRWIDEIEEVNRSGKQTEL